MFSETSNGKRDDVIDPSHLFNDEGFAVFNAYKVSVKSGNCG